MKKPWPKITAEMLLEKGAGDEIEIFRALWPHGVKPSQKVILKAAGAGLDLNGLAERLLSPSALEAYKGEAAAAWGAYKKAILPTWKAYNKAYAAAWKVFRGASAASKRKGYEKAVAPTSEAYGVAVAMAEKAYREACAVALADVMGLE